MTMSDEQLHDLADELGQVLALAGFPVEAGDEAVWPGHGHFEIDVVRPFDRVDRGVEVRWVSSSRLERLALSDFALCMDGEGGPQTAMRFNSAVKDAAEVALRSLFDALGYEVEPPVGDASEDGPMPWAVLVTDAGDGRGAHVAGLA